MKAIKQDFKTYKVYCLEWKTGKAIYRIGIITIFKDVFFWGLLHGKEYDFFATNFLWFGYNRKLI